MEISEIKKYYKLNKDCRLFKCENKYFIGDTERGLLFETDDKGYKFVESLVAGCELDKNVLADCEQEIIDVLDRYNFFREEEKHYRVDTAYLHVTDRCNLKCKGCYSYVENRNNKIDMTFEEIKKVLINLKNSGLKNLIISGGEPFLRYDITDILKFAKVDLNINHILCISNGYSERERYLEACKYIDRLSLSLDGYDSESSMIRSSKVFEKVDSLIDYLKDKTNISIIFTEHKKNMYKEDKLKKYAEAKCVDYNFSILCVKKSYFKDYEGFIFLEEDYDKLSDIICDYPVEDTSISDRLFCSNSCGAGKELISIASNGDIMPCHMFVEKKFSLGNAIVDDIEQIVNSENNRFYNLNVDDVKECFNCEYKYLCGGGCRFRGYSYSDNEDVKTKDVLCKAYKTSISRLISQKL